MACPGLLRTLALGLGIVLAEDGLAASREVLARPETSHILCLDHGGPRAKAVDAAGHADVLRCLMRLPRRPEHGHSPRDIRRCLSQQGDLLFADCSY
jgi:hypothetical protein